MDKCKPLNTGLIKASEEWRDEDVSKAGRCTFTLSTPR